VVLDADVAAGVLAGPGEVLRRVAGVDDQQIRVGGLRYTSRSSTNVPFSVRKAE
jgi:hypothetical protein